MMTQPDDRAQQAKKLYEEKQFAEAGALYHALWDAHGDAFSGGRYALCLRKCGHAEAALTIANQVAEKHPDDIYVKREVVWATYGARLKPAKQKEDLGALLQAAQQVVSLTEEDLPIRLATFAVIDVAKSKGKWDIVSAWCDRIDPQSLSLEKREVGGRRILSEREQWYFAKVKALVQLEQWPHARQLADTARQTFPRNTHFQRWAALAQAGEGDLAGAIQGLENLIQQGASDWFILADLAQLQLQQGQLEDALQTASQAAMAYGEDKAKVNLFVMIGEIALALEKFDVAVQHFSLARLVRLREGWSIPNSLVRLEAQAREAYAHGSADPLENWTDVSALFKMCRQTWNQIIPPELKPKPKQKHRSRPKTSQAGPKQTGQIKIYNQDRGFGFIQPDDGGQDLFFHITNVTGIALPDQGMRVQFQEIETPKGLNAVNVERLNN